MFGLLWTLSFIDVCTYTFDGFDLAVETPTVLFTNTEDRTQLIRSISEETNEAVGNLVQHTTDTSRSIDNPTSLFEGRVQILSSV
jgi:hypothetical protein